MVHQTRPLGDLSRYIGEQMALKVFISWSGTTSHKVAIVLREWLPSVIQSLKPYVSSEDIDKGARWSTDIAGELEKSLFGIICITTDNLLAPWINFEAGALSKSLDKSKVSPFLYGVKRSEVHGPLLQFQSTVHEKPDVKKLLLSINASLETNERLTNEALERAFDVWWPELERKLGEIPKPETVTELVKPKKDSKDQILEEILELSRQQQRLLNDPETLLPPPYFEHIMRTVSPSMSEERLEPIHDMLIELEHLTEKFAKDHPETLEIAAIADRMHRYFHERVSRHRRPLERKRRGIPASVPKPSTTD